MSEPHISNADYADLLDSTIFRLETRCDANKNFAIGEPFARTIINELREAGRRLRVTPSSDERSDETPCRVNEAVGLLQEAAERFQAIGVAPATMNRIDAFLATVHPAECSPFWNCRAFDNALKHAAPQEAEAGREAQAAITTGAPAVAAPSLAQIEEALRNSVNWGRCSIGTFNEVLAAVRRVVVNDAIDIAQCAIHDTVKDPLERDRLKEVLEGLRVPRSAPSSPEEARVDLAKDPLFSVAASPDNPTAFGARSDTPRTDAQAVHLREDECLYTKGEYVAADFARQLERERNAWEEKFQRECEKHDATTARAMQAERACSASTQVEQWVVASLERIADDYEARAAKLAEKGDYSCQFPEAEAKAVRLALAALSSDERSEEAKS